jgi:hypothetical protein
VRTRTKAAEIIPLRIHQRSCYRAYNRITNAEVTVVRKLNQTSSPENVMSSFSGVLFVSFCTSKKKIKARRRRELEMTAASFCLSFLRLSFVNCSYHVRYSLAPASLRSEHGAKKKRRKSEEQPKKRIFWSSN